MCLKIILVITLCLSEVLSSPILNSQSNKYEDKSTASTSNGNFQELIETTKETPKIFDVQSKKPNDLTGQETFYPGGGIWWDFRPWGGWGGYRPWHGPHWPHWGGGRWGGHWGGGGWGGHWGGGGWGSQLGRTSS